ncbi:SAM-dependent methyltransferase [Govanella unica]|uniref:Cyclopropane-fatty-acyl-phospholipid synthase family protein n=1 Tax=Govanella unica TaxID=2975056 RepID=A0A9X3Z675_9PROT|nr:cyclopropane-fatty-acyl-phospholipid synthase family protein [Govania unica]MDA5192649.1 cyclopropane-fatty-acyl-phospholipid synthase family protein [Govania unica]
MFLLSILLKNLLKIGTLNIIDVDGKTYRFVGSPSPEMTLRLHDRKVAWDIGWHSSLAMGEAYMDGRVTFEKGDIREFLKLVMANRNFYPRNNRMTLKRWLKRQTGHLFQHNPISRSRENVHHHYDLSGELYDLFLDADRQYSCAYFPTGTEDLETAQLLKKAHIAAKLCLKAGQRVLDIGCGWGGMALYLNRVAGVKVKGVTLSDEQLAVAKGRAAKSGVSNDVDFQLQDYRTVTERYDRVVSVGMFEHVGVPQYQTFFDTLYNVTTDDCVALLHTIGRSDGPGRTNSWVRKYIFPGGYSPALSEILPVIEQAGFYVTDIEILRLHYAKTLKHWWDRVQQNRDKIIALYDERFLRMWEFYLAASEWTFHYSDHVVFQIQLAKQQDAVPFTRDYIYEKERELIAMDAAARANEKLKLA